MNTYAKCDWCERYVKIGSLRKVEVRQYAYTSYVTKENIEDVIMEVCIPCRKAADERSLANARGDNTSKRQDRED